MIPYASARSIPNLSTKSPRVDLGQSHRGGDRKPDVGERVFGEHGRVRDHLIVKGRAVEERSSVASESIEEGRWELLSAEDDRRRSTKKQKHADHEVIAHGKNPDHPVVRGHLQAFVSSVRPLCDGLMGEHDAFAGAGGPRREANECRVQRVVLLGKIVPGGATLKEQGLPEGTPRKDRMGMVEGKQLAVGDQEGDVDVFQDRVHFIAGSRPETRERWQPLQPERRG